MPRFTSMQPRKKQKAGAREGARLNSRKRDDRDQEEVLLRGKSNEYVSAVCR